jgi:hypothetical protein
MNTAIVKAGTLADKLDLTMMQQPELREIAIDAYSEGDFKTFFYCALMVNDNAAMRLFMDNAAAFESDGVTERALLAAWMMQEHTGSWSSIVKLLLMTCDRKKLLAAGNHLPEGETFTLYRGVEDGFKKQRGFNFKWVKDKRGISWTSDLEVARRFASRHGTGGKVYTTTIKRSDVYAYIDGERKESEYLLVLNNKHPLEMLEKVESRRRP